MNILIITEHFYPESGATSNILFRLSKKFIENGKHVFIANINKNVKSDNRYTHEEIEIFEVAIDNINMKKQVIDAYEEKDYKNFLLYGIRYAIIKQKINIYSTEAYLPEYTKNLNKLLNIVITNKIDVIITVCDPFYTNYYGYLLKKRMDIKWIMYMLDPFFNHFNGISYIKKKIQYESSMLDIADRVIVTKQIYDSYMNSELKKYIYKVEKLELPIIRDLTVNNNLKNTFDDSFINCSFIGYLYPKIRDPKFVLEVFSRIKSKNIKLNIIGGVYGEFDNSYIDYFKSVLKEKLEVYGPVDADKAIDLMKESDILINIGNNYEHQIPSKIFDYFSTGKPIINFYSLDHCPTLEYTQRYSKCIDISQADSVSDDVVKRVEEFILANENSIISYSDIIKTLRDCSSDSVSEKFLNILDRLWKGGE